MLENTDTLLALAWTAVVFAGFAALVSVIRRRFNRAFGLESGSHLTQSPYPTAG